MFRNLLTAALAILLFIASPSVARQAADETTRRYDVRELVIAIPDFEEDFAPAQPEGASRAGASRAGASAPSQAEVVGQLLSSVRLALGDERVKMHEESGQLVVTGSAAAHERVETFVAEMRRQHAAQVNVECRFLALSHAALDKLSPEMRTSLALAPRVPQALGQADLAHLDELMRQEEGVESISAPNLSLFGQQKAYVTVTSLQHYVADVEPVAGGGWQPKVGSAEHGFKVMVRAAASPDRANAAAEVRWWLQRILDMETVEVAPDAVKQQPRLETRQGTRLVSGPAGTTFLVGVSETAPPRDAPQDAPADLLLLLVKLTPTATPPDVLEPAHKRE